MRRVKILFNKVFKNPYKNGGLSGYHHENKTTSTNRWELTVVSLWFSNRFEHAEKTGLNRSFFSAVSPMKTKAKTPVFEAKKTGPHRLPKIETVLRVPQCRNTGNETGGWWDLTSDKSTFKNNTKGLAQYSIYLRALMLLSRSCWLSHWPVTSRDWQNRPDQDRRRGLGPDYGRSTACGLILFKLVRIGLAR